MIIFPCNRSVCRLLIVATVVLALVFFSAGRRASAQSPVRSPEAAEQTEKIHIVADRLTSDSETRFAEFIGNVRATQGETVITSDRLKIFYSENLAASKTPSTDEGAVKKIIASGNVRISFDNRIATAREAVYDSESKTLVLSGPRSKIISGSDSITGEKITYNRSDGRITVESGRDSRVEAVFHSGGGGIR